MDERDISALLQALVFTIPLNVYGIGDGLAAGITWALFKVQVPFIVPDPSPFLITPFREFGYISSQVIGGRTVIAVALWYCGTALLVAALACLLHARLRQGTCRLKDARAVLTILAGLLFLISSAVQYGPLLHGQSGFAIPVGVPLVLFIGYHAFRLDRQAAVVNEPPAESTAKEPESGL